MGVRRPSFLFWVTSLVLGAITISPFLIQVAPAYFGANATAFTGGVTDIRLALLSTKLLPLDIVIPLLVFVFLYFLFSKYYQGKFLTLSTVLLVLWWLIPTALTQGYLVGLYTDFERFLYFVILPIMILIGLGLYHSARFFSQAIDFLMGVVKDLPQIRLSSNPRIKKIIPHITQKNTLQVFALVFVLFAFLAVPIFVTPPQGIGVQTFYQLMNNPEYEAILWAQNSTPTNAVFLTDAQYGWWFSGFALRPTISAVEPQYLTNAREFEPAKVARYVLDTDYLVDNGLIQIREDGGYIGRHNPEFLVRVNESKFYSYFPYPFLNFDNSQIDVEFRVAESSQPVHRSYLSDIPVTKMYAENDNKTASVYVIRQNEYLNITQITTLAAGVRFANMTIAVSSDNPNVTFDRIAFTVPTKGTFVEGDKSTIGQIDKFYNVQGQIIFTSENKPEEVTNKNGPITFSYNLGAKTSGDVNLSVGLYELKPPENLTLSSPDQDWTNFGKEQLMAFSKNYTQSVDTPASLDFFDYRQGMNSQNISYIAVRDPVQIPRFSKDPMFSLVFINNEVAIFQVHNAT